MFLGDLKMEDLWLKFKIKLFEKMKLLLLINSMQWKKLKIAAFVKPCAFEAVQWEV